MSDKPTRGGSLERMDGRAENDTGSAAAKARDEWLDGPEGTPAQDASTLGGNHPNYYLRNRLERAFLAGMEAERRIHGEGSSIDPKLSDGGAWRGSCVVERGESDRA